MKRSRRFGLWSALGIGLLLLSQAGCQTWSSDFGGITLPSGRYLQHPPQVFPSDPDYPLPRELEHMQAQNAQGLPGGPPGPLPRPVPVGP